jgi:hypothetical protein
MTLLRVPVLLLLIFSGPALSWSGTIVQTRDCDTPLDSPCTVSPGTELTRNMSRNQRHVFQLHLGPKQFTRVIVEQKGSDVVVRLLDSNNVVLVDRDSPNGKLGPETVSILTQSDAVYFIEVYANALQPSAAYDLRVEPVQDATEQHQARVDAERLLMEGRTLIEKKTAESRNLAIERFARAVEIWKIVRDAREEGYALCNIAHPVCVDRVRPPCAARDRRP